LLEDAYGSKLSLTIDSNTVKGTYAPPSPSGMGHAVLEGLLEEGKFKGQWQHVQGPSSQGSFEMSWDGNGVVGWWKDLEGLEQQWKWANARSHMEDFSMFSAWLFFALTLAQTVSAVSLWQWNAELNFCCNAVCTVFYAIFLHSYRWQPPHWAYVSGVALYLAGYIAFLCIYSFVLLGVGYHAAWYHSGAWCFLVGSALLLVATKPKRISCSLDASLWWGSLMFLLGSLCFAEDALLPMGLSPAGLVVFTAGRLFFVRGSQTERCDIFFRRSKPFLR
jgi:hypothetical protein